MIHTDGIQTIANAPLREASPARRVPRVSDVRLTDEQWLVIEDLVLQTAESLGLTQEEADAAEALHRELQHRRRPVESR